MQRAHPNHDTISVRRIPAPHSAPLHHAPASRATNHGHAVEKNEAAKKLGIRITQGWGLSETTCAVCGVPTEQKPSIGNVVVLMPRSEVMPVGDEEREAGRREAGRRERDEAYTRGRQIAAEYRKSSEATGRRLGVSG
ncbi:hypothetical protein K432DRAFT_460320 [Lepidopterella palustris CBS 459.81]|uniref:Uncharacterized protein n=1 Tax=Lepidopterella palustris CBS 459.81 TaxID=1314670 RepID=A0A8E2JCL5_9PEZI|nr:hypothetical protein K432DRAFT_460320 [Lepidopterella palustris CBS 459.81]